MFYVNSAQLRSNKKVIVRLLSKEHGGPGLAVGR